MSIPLPMGTRFDIALWLGDEKLHLRGQVVSLQPGFGNGVSFVDLAPASREWLCRFIATLALPQTTAEALAKVTGQ
jgi:hypothetical protein